MAKVPPVGHGNLIPENTTHPEHLNLATRRAENLEKIAGKRRLNPHEQEIYDNARRVRDRNAPLPSVRRNRGNAEDLVMAGGGPDSQTHGAEAEVPPAVPDQAPNAIGTTIEGPSTTNPDAPIASADRASGNVGSPQTAGASAPNVQGNAGLQPNGSNGGTSSSSGSHAGDTVSTTGGGLTSSPPPAPSLPGKNHISGGVPELPKGAKLLQSSDHWFIFEEGGKKWVRFYAPEARSPNTAKKGGVGDGHDNTAAYLTPEGKIYVEEGQHRLNGVALEGETNLSSVPGHPKWLEYEFKGSTGAKGQPPAYNPGETHENVNRINPWDGLRGY